MTTPPAKILLTNSTKVSLNDRFTKLSKVRAETAPSALAITKNISPTGRAATAKNRQLAAQMAQRPAVQAAFKVKQRTMNMNQRLSGIRGGGVGISPKRLQSAGPTNPANLARRLSGGNIRNRLQFKGGQPRQRSLPPNRQSPRVFTNSKLGGRPQRTTPNRQNNRINKNNGNGNGVVPMSTEPIKKSLDMDLDEYMSKSKSHLNADLDTYMSKSKNHLDADLDTYMAQAQSSTQQ